MKTAIILPSYVIDEENLAHYRKFIETLRAHTPRDSYYLIIVDNGSKVGREEMKQDADMYFGDANPLGYARAVNIGVALAETMQEFHQFDGRYVVANNDIEFTEPWLEKMHEVYNGTGGLLAPQDAGSEQAPLYPNESWYSLWMIDKHTWNAVGTLDDDKLNFRFHDQDYSIRLAKAGFFVGRTGLVHVKHLNSATYKKMNRNEDPEERQEMIRRHGFALFNEWYRDHVART